MCYYFFIGQDIKGVIIRERIRMLYIEDILVKVNYYEVIIS